MPITMKCPHCDARETFPDGDAGQSVSCSSCGGAVTVPAKARPVAAAVVAKPRPVVVAAAVVAKPQPESGFTFDDDEPKPRKKSKPVVELDDDEDEPTPRKKSKAVVEAEPEPKPRKKSKPVVELDDEDDDRPKRKSAQKKGGSKKILLILGGIAFVLLAGCGGVAAYLYIRADEAVADFKSQLTTPTDTTPKTNNQNPPPADLRSNASTVLRVDTYDVVVSRRLGLGQDCRIEDLRDLVKTFKDPNGADTALFESILDQYAPWVAQGCAKMYTSPDLKTRVLIVFGDSNFTLANNPALRVKGLIIIGTGGTRTTYSEPLAVTRDLESDNDAVRLKLKRWLNLKPEPTGEPIPVPGDGTKFKAEDLAAEVIKDRAAAAKKYAGKTLEVTGEVVLKSATGSSVFLKGGTDEVTMKALLVAFSMKADERAAALKCQLGDTVTVTGVFPASLSANATTIPCREGAMKK